MSNTSFSTIIIGDSRNIITSEPISGQMTFQDSIITNPIKLSEIVNNRNNIYTPLSTTTSITGDFQSQINNINNIIYGMSIVF